MAKTGRSATGEFPDLGGKPSINGPHRPDGIYVIRFRNTHDGRGSTKYLRGFGYQGYGGIDFNWRARGFGEAYKRALLDPAITVGIGGYGECLPRWENYVAIDPGVKDIFGIPVLRVQMSYGENEFALVKAIIEDRDAARGGGERYSPSTLYPGRRARLGDS